MTSSAIPNLAARIVPKIVGKNKLLILMYHRVIKQRDPLLSEVICENEFECQISTLTKHFNVISLSEASELLRSAKLPERTVCVTFDDGYADNFEVALPILKKWNVPATFFVATGFLNGGTMWNDKIIESIRNAKSELLDLTSINLEVYPIRDAEEKRGAIGTVLRNLKYRPDPERERCVDQVVEMTSAQLPVKLMMSSNQVKALYDAGMSIGAHTVNHPILTSVSDHDAKEEIQQSRDYLQDLTGVDIRAFAYPNGRPGKDYYKRHVELVEKTGFEVCVSTAWGYADETMDRFQLPRIGFSNATEIGFTLRLLKTYVENKPKLL